MEDVSAHSVADPAPGPMSGADLVTLYRRQRPAMVRLATLLTGSAVVAEEVVQEAFLKLHTQRRRPDNPDGYLRVVVTNLARSHLRRLRLERRVPPSDHGVSDLPDVDETWAAVRRLPFRQRAALVLRFYEDLSEADIARTLQCRPGTVKSRLHRGLAALRKELG